MSTAASAGVRQALDAGQGLGRRIAGGPLHTICRTGTSRASPVILLPWLFLEPLPCGVPESQPMRTVAVTAVPDRFCVP